MVNLLLSFTILSGSTRLQSCVACVTYFSWSLFVCSFLLASSCEKLQVIFWRENKIYMQVNDVNGMGTILNVEPSDVSMFNQ